MNWRPKEGWKNPFKRGRLILFAHPDKHISEHFEAEEREFQIYEAGADAMHKADMEFIGEHNISKDKSCIVISNDSWLEFQGKL